MCVCAQDEIERQGSVLVDYADLTGNQTVRAALPDLTTQLKEQPEVLLKCLGVAIHQVHIYRHYYSQMSCAYFIILIMHSKKIIFNALKMNYWCVIVHIIRHYEQLSLRYNIETLNCEVCEGEKCRTAPLRH